MLLELLDGCNLIFSRLAGAFCCLEEAIAEEASRNRPKTSPVQVTPNGPRVVLTPHLFMPIGTPFFPAAVEAPAQPSTPRLRQPCTAEDRACTEATKETLSPKASTVENGVEDSAAEDSGAEDSIAGESVAE